MTPNSPPSFFFPRLWEREHPALFAWVKAHSLHMEKSINREGWDVWMPVYEAERGKPQPSTPATDDSNP